MIRTYHNSKVLKVGDRVTWHRLPGIDVTVRINENNRVVIHIYHHGSLKDQEVDHRAYQPAQPTSELVWQHVGAPVEIDLPTLDEILEQLARMQKFMAARP